LEDTKNNLLTLELKIGNRFTVKGESVLLYLNTCNKRKCFSYYLICRRVNNMEYIKQYTKFLLIAYVIAVILLSLSSVIFAYTNINDSLINIFVFANVVITNLIGSTLLGIRLKRKGFVIGLIFGLIYFLILYLISVIFYTGFFANQMVGLYLGLCAISSIVGGIIGVNIR